jgi:hypothetical protein
VLTLGETRRELLYHATEFMLGRGRITPAKAELREPFRAIDTRMQSAIDTRYQLGEWRPQAYVTHKRGDHLSRRDRSFPRRGLEPGRHRQDSAHRGRPTLPRSSFAVRFRAFGTLAPGHCAEAVHRSVQFTQSTHKPVPGMIPFRDLASIRKNHECGCLG